MNCFVEIFLLLFFPPTAKRCSVALFSPTAKSSSTALQCCVFFSNDEINLSDPPQMPDGEINLTDLDAALREYSGAERLSDVDRGEILKRLHVSAEGVFNYDEYIQLMLK